MSMVFPSKIKRGWGDVSIQSSKFLIGSGFFVYKHSCLENVGPGLSRCISYIEPMGIYSSNRDR